MQEIKKIDFYCRVCNKSLKISHGITGNGATPVLPNLIITCHHCKNVKRAICLKKFDEEALLRGSEHGKYFI